jgi:hypothetical protein
MHPLKPLTIRNPPQFALEANVSAANQTAHDNRKEENVSSVRTKCLMFGALKTLV